MDKTNTILWKIGSSVVMTVPSGIVNRFGIGSNKKMLTVALKIERETIKFPAKPWKCGGSFVVTIPSTYVELYTLRSLVENKTSLHSSINLAKAVTIG